VVKTCLWPEREREPVSKLLFKLESRLGQNHGNSGFRFCALSLASVCWPPFESLGQLE